MTDAQMYSRLLAGDPSYNGRFFTGVLTTGIYCLPSCKARKPKAENVRFFPTCEAARAAGLRPCRKCHPDDYARGADPVLETVESLVETVRARPQDFIDAGAIVQRSGFGTTRLFELFRQHYHLTPGDLLVRARLDASLVQLRSGRSVAEAALAVGFESLSAYHDQFRRVYGLTPGGYQTLPRSRSFTLHLPPHYPLAYLKRGLGRDPASVTEALEGDVFRAAVRLGETPALLTMVFSPEAVEVHLSDGDAHAAHTLACGVLGLGQTCEAFARLAGKLGLSRLVAGREHLRVSQTTSVFDGLLWAVIGQQINLPFAFVLRRRLIERAGERLEGTPFRLLPTPARVASLTPAELAPLQFSQRKAEYVIDLSRKVAEGKLPLDTLARASATRVERLLLEQRGLGPWSVNYLMMRSLGFADCVPLGDTGVTSGLQALFKLEQRPDVDATRRLMSVFAPFRSLATAHLWNYNRPTP